MIEALESSSMTSRQHSPMPRRQLSSLPLNQRSYSRMSSKGVFGSESPLISPLPYYPKRRSVTFAHEHREERPFYNTLLSAPASPARTDSPPPVSILKKFYTGIAKDDRGHQTEDRGGAAAETVPRSLPAATITGGARRSTRSSPTPKRGRSNSRQRLAARRHEAQLHHSFYDDSFVEEYVLKAKTQIEEEMEQHELEQQTKGENQEGEQVERRIADTKDEISVLQQAKQTLMTTAPPSRFSPTPTPPPPAPLSPPAAITKSTSEACSKERKVPGHRAKAPVPEMGAGLTEVCHALSAGQTNKHPSRPGSVPLVSDGVLLEISESPEEADPRANDEAWERQKLERIVSDILSQRKKLKSKRSVLVIDWADLDKGKEGVKVKTSIEDEDAIQNSLASLQPRRGARRRTGPSKSRSVVLPDVPQIPPSLPEKSKSSLKRNLSVHSRNPSMIPELEDSLNFHEITDDQPILIPRRQRKRPALNRSLSQLTIEADDDTFDEAAVHRAVRKPPQVNRAPAKSTSRRTRSKVRVNTTSTTHNHHRGRSYQSDREDETASRLASTRRPRSVGPLSKSSKPSPDDPMAVFFDAAFPSPSKFDDMMMQSGGLPEARRNTGRGYTRQPNLILPASIIRRR